MSTSQQQPGTPSPRTQGSNKGISGRPVYLFDVPSTMLLGQFRKKLEAKQKELEAYPEAGDQSAYAALDEEIKKLSEKLDGFENEDEIPSDIIAIGLIQLTAKEEVDCARSVKNGDIMGLSESLTKRSLVEIHSGDLESPTIRNLSKVDMSIDAFWNDIKTIAPLRTLIMAAHSEVHAPSEKAVRLFRKSRRIVTR